MLARARGRTGELILDIWMTDKTWVPVKLALRVQNCCGFTRICTDYSRLIRENPR